LSARRLSVLCVSAFALCAAFCPLAVADPFMLEATGSRTGLGEVRAIGDFRPGRDPTLGAANGVFGPPTKVVRTSDASCRVLYGGIGLRFAFVNLGGGGPCDPDLTKSQVARAFDPRWRTGRGLGIGDPIRRLWRLYPGATRHGRSWWLVKGMNIFGVGNNPYPVLRATMKRGRVGSFALSIGAAGE
jgi:hypothetical protein